MGSFPETWIGVKPLGISFVNKVKLSVQTVNTDRSNTEVQFGSKRFCRGFR